MKKDMESPNRLMHSTIPYDKFSSGHPGRPPAPFHYLANRGESSMPYHVQISEEDLPVLSAVAGRALTLLSDSEVGNREIDELIRQTGRASAEVTRALALMELRGLVHHMGNMSWATAR